MLKAPESIQTGEKHSASHTRGLLRLVLGALLVLPPAAHAQSIESASVSEQAAADMARLRSNHKAEIDSARGNRMSKDELPRISAEEIGRGIIPLEVAYKILTAIKLDLLWDGRPSERYGRLVTTALYEAGAVSVDRPQQVVSGQRAALRVRYMKQDGEEETYELSFSWGRSRDSRDDQRVARHDDPSDVSKDGTHRVAQRMEFSLQGARRRSRGYWVEDMDDVAFVPPISGNTREEGVPVAVAIDPAVRVLFGQR